MRSFFLVFSILIFSASQAYALSCVMPILNDEAIEAASLIFEGTVLGDDGSVEVPENKSGELHKFHFKLDKLWKGDVHSDQIMIIRNVYWGDEFDQGKKYLVVANTLGSENHIAKICGNTVHIGIAGDKLEILKLKFGIKKDNIKDNIGDN